MLPSKDQRQKNVGLATVWAMSFVCSNLPSQIVRIEQSDLAGLGGRIEQNDPKGIIAQISLSDPNGRIESSGQTGLNVRIDLVVRQDPIVHLDRDVE
jgi:hypothetical protein